jgi:hypothetical protein
MERTWEELENSFSVPFAVLPNIPNAKTLCGLEETEAIRRLQCMGWTFVSTHQDYRLYFKHMGGYYLRLGLEMCEESGAMIVAFVDAYGTTASS